MGAGAVRRHPLYEDPNPQRGWHQEWGFHIFNFRADAGLVQPVDEPPAVLCGHSWAAERPQPEHG
ncbi:hypothetical protein [Nocardioides sp. LHG3406-4]|uniref:hypothetical protein n=1 Tax=Nocardioides sp. LHG3406-4 TaxID=2804575 RepID=UPI003CEF9B94